MPLNNLPNLASKVDQITTQNIDMRGRRCINAGDAQDGKDYVTLNQATQLINGAIDEIPVASSQQTGDVETVVKIDPIRFMDGATEMARFSGASPNKDSLLIGLPSSDITLTSPGIIASNAICVASAAVNCSTINFSVVPGSFAALTSYKTGSGTALPLAFFSGHAQRVTILTGGPTLVGSTTDDGTGKLFQVNDSVSINGSVITGSSQTLVAKTADFTTNLTTQTGGTPPIGLYRLNVYAICTVINGTGLNVSFFVNFNDGVATFGPGIGTLTMTVANSAPMTASYAFWSDGVHVPTIQTICGGYSGGATFKVAWTFQRL